MSIEDTASPILFAFSAGSKVEQPDPELMGIKGANLAEMASLGLPVPPGFVVNAKLGQQIASGDDALSVSQRKAIKNSITAIENSMGRQFGGTESPLLVSVRSGAAISMPGMMDTVLNLGLNKSTVEALAADTGDARFAWDSYRRFIQSFSHVVLDLDSEDFEDVLDEIRTRNDVDTDAELPAHALQEITDIFLGIVQKTVGEPFPQDVFEQLDLALLAVFNSWNTPRARRYRDMQGVSHEGGTAAIIQAMVFGNRDHTSCTGVYFTRNPSTGANLAYGEYMPNAQGEDVVSGIRTPMELTEAARAMSMSDNASMEKTLPAAFDELMTIGPKLERHFRDMQEVEFTVESNRLFLLQTRSGKRTARAGLRIAVDMVNEKIISKQEAVQSCDLNALGSLLVSKVEPAKNTSFVTKGLPASPGAATGQIVFTSDEAVALFKQGIDCILVRPETDPKDVHGMHASAGILTTRGGMTSHAAVVARGMGKPCITAAMTLKIDLANQICSCAGQIMRSGDIITIDGSSGLVYQGKQPIVTPEPDGELATLLAWNEELVS